MVRRYELTDEQWSQLAPLLPPQRQRTGRPSLDHRTVLNGILWIKRSGSAWRDLPERYGNWKTVSSRFYRWQQQGLWTQLLARVQERADHASHVNWDVHMIDSTIVRAHHSAAGATKETATKRSAAHKAASGRRST
ncbi:IS5 family transposase [Deinococcus rufus]|uniref:IS5 family transposase n=1 Tax=Deinococcus rufus TaxID=2136097 RepID=A0ABV7ZAP4_9DEIO